MRNQRLTKFIVLLLFLLSSTYAFATSPMYKGEVQNEPPKKYLGNVIDRIGIDQKLNAQVNLSTQFKDENGAPVQLSNYFGKRPIILVMVYYECPMLCTQVLNGVLGTAKALPFDAGKDYDVVVISFNPKEGPNLALAKKNTSLAGYHMEDRAAGWHFLTGTKASIDQVANAVGFRYVYDSLSNQYAHASGIMVLTPEGKVSRYFYGVEFPPKDLKFGLMDAADHHIGSVVDEVLLYCYHYDPNTGRYGGFVMTLLRVGGIITLLGMGALFFILRRRRIPPSSA